MALLGMNNKKESELTTTYKFLAVVTVIKVDGLIMIFRNTFMLNHLCKFTSIATKTV